MSGGQCKRDFRPNVSLFFYGIFFWCICPLKFILTKCIFIPTSLGFSTVFAVDVQFYVNSYLIAKFKKFKIAIVALFSFLECPWPEEPVNASFNISGRKYADILNYTCDPDHVLMGGDLLRSCGRKRHWTGSPPNCIGKSIRFIYFFTYLDTNYVYIYSFNLISLFWAVLLQINVV